ncbi:hypothetical protein H8E88_22365 [candidate division KSB1 bacterium]|nr:hypothetical protein [candidate division KSB1 bacterium]
MDKKRMNIIWGTLIVLFGVLLLLVTTDVIDIRVNTAWIFGVLFFFGFLIFIGMYFSMHRSQFWPLIPGITSLGLCLLILSEEIGMRGQVGAGLFMLFIGLSFLAVAIFHNEHWWAIIPAGMVGSVSMVIFFGDILGVGLMFLCMGITFLGLYFVLQPRPEKHWWPLIPGGILAFMGILFLFFGPIEFGNYILPVALIVVGAIIFIKALKGQKEVSE